jgi:hypothetical protein
MMTKKNAKKQFRAFRRMAENRFDDMGTGQKMAGAAVAGLILGLTSMLFRSLKSGQCSDCPAKMDIEGGAQTA